MRRLIIFMVAVALYGVSVLGGFVQDDRRVILGDSSLGKWQGLVYAWTAPYYKNDPSAGAYRPLTSITLAIDALVFGKQAWGFRLINALLYGLVCAAVFELGKRMFGGETEAFWLALLFTVLPIHTEAVSNIVGRGEILAGGLVIVALVSAMDKKWGLSMLMFFLALLSKESAIVWVMPLGWLLWKSDLRTEKKYGLVMIFVLLFGEYFLLRWGILGGGIFSDNASMVENPLKYVSGWERVRAGIGLVGFGVGKVLLPIKLSYDYSFSQLKLADLTGMWFVLGTVMVFLFFWLCSRRKKALNWGMAFLWLPLLVTGNIVKPIGTIFGERLWFLPSLGVVAIAVYLSKFGLRSLRLSAGRQVVSAPLAMTFMTLILILFAGRTLVRNLDWLSEEKLFVKDAAYVTESVLAQNNAAAMYLMKKEPDGARVYLDRAESIYPKYPELMNNWGIYFWQKGDLVAAEARFRKCLEAYPGNGLCSGNLRDLKMGVK